MQDCEGIFFTLSECIYNLNLLINQNQTTDKLMMNIIISFLCYVQFRRRLTSLGLTVENEAVGLKILKHAFGRFRMFSAIKEYGERLIILILGIYPL